MMVDEERREGRGRIGAEIYEQVEKMISEEKLTRTEAFQRLSDATGRRPGTVAANYYRVARQRGATLQPRVRRGAGRPRRAGRPAGGAGDAQAVLGRALSALDELGGLVRRQEQELVRLRDENTQFDQIRKLMKRVK
jgi:DNA-binding transcriptional ArsR family regulator